MLPGIKQGGCTSLRYTSEPIWRRSPFDLDDYIVDQLRTKPCYVDDHMRMLAAAAVEDVEKSVSIGIPLQVRELRLNRFPACDDPIRLDFPSAWTETMWTDFVDSFGSSSEDVDDVSDIEAIDELFGDDSPPLSIRYGGCCEDAESIVDADSYILKRSEQGDSICLVDCDCWPANCSCGRCDYARIKYVCGHATSAALAATRPRFLHNILATFGYLYENPELMQSTGSVYESAIMKMRLGSKWRI